MASRRMRMASVLTSLRCESLPAAAVISEAFPAGAGNEELPLQAAPSVRTNEVFLMGTVQDIQAAEALVLLLDQARTPARRGCGEAGF